MSQQIFYPCVDGFVTDSTSNQTWAAKRAAGGTGSNDSGTSGSLCYIGASLIYDLWNSIHRALLVFDTSALPDNAVISDAYIRVFIYGKNLTLSISPSVGVYSSNPASPTAIVPGDFDSVGGTLFSNSITYANIQVGAYNQFNLNSSGRAAISKTGYSKFSFREVVYDGGGSPPTWTSEQYLSVFYRPTEYGASYKPQLVVIYTAPATYYESVSDSLGLNETPKANIIWVSTPVSDSLGLDDTPSVRSVFSGTVADSLGMDESPVVKGSADEEISDSFGLDDTPSYDVGASVYEESVSDSLGLNETPSAGAIFASTVSDSVGLGDANEPSVPINIFYESVTDSFYLYDEPFNYRGPHVVRNLLDVRQKFIKVSGREDLAITSHLDHDVDNGADFFIRAGSGYLDSTQPTHHEFTWYSETLAIGEYASKFKNCRAIKGVHYINADGEEKELTKASLDSLMRAYPEQENTDVGTPLVYTMYPQQRPPAQLSSGEDYDYVGIRVMPPTDEAITLKVYGLFDSNPLVENFDENQWSVNHPDLLILAALMKLKGLYEDITGAAGFRTQIEDALLGVDKDVADYIESDGLTMKG